LTGRMPLFGPTRQVGDTKMILLNVEKETAQSSIKYPQDLGAYDAENISPEKTQKRKNIFGGRATESAPPPTPRKKQRYATRKDIAQASSPKSPTPQTSET
ncbi:hypothetical protein HDU99_000461, partial [Rhizoclosmatium hyalinum]